MVDAGTSDEIMRMRELSPEDTDEDTSDTEFLLRDERAERERAALEKEFPEPSWKTLLLLRSLFFLAGISGSTWGRFSTVYYNEKGLSREQIGMIEGVMPILVACMQPFWGFVSDHTKSPRFVFAFTRVVSTCILMLLAFPAIAYGYTRLLLISLFMSLFITGGILDGYTLDVLGPHGQRLYGPLRMWCAISWGAGSFVMGIVNDLFGFDWNFLLYFVFCTIQLVTMACCMTPTGHEHKKHPDHGDRRELMKLLKSSSFIAFLVEVFVFGMCMGVVEKGLLFVYLINDLKATTTLCGAVVGVTVIFELPVFHYSQKILHFLGFRGAVLSSYVSYMVRVYGYTLLTKHTVHWIYALEMLHGITFAVLWIALVDEARRITPPGWSSTVQSLLSAMYQSFGMGVGAILGGFAMEYYGSVFMFRGAVVLASLLVLRHLLSFLLSSFARCCRPSHLPPEL